MDSVDANPAPPGMVEAQTKSWDVYHRFQLAQDFATIHRMMQSPAIAPFAQRHVLSRRRDHGPGDQGTQRLSQARERRQEETVESSADARSFERPKMAGWWLT